MRIKVKELPLLQEIRRRLVRHNELELATRLSEIIERQGESQDKERTANRQRAAANREAGYKWKSSIHPKKSKYRLRNKFPKKH